MKRGNFVIKLVFGILGGIFLLVGAGLLCGAVAAVVAYFLVRGIWYLLHRFEDRALFRLALEFDLYVTVRRLQQRISSRHGEKEEKKDCGCEQKEEEK